MSVFWQEAFETWAHKNSFLSLELLPGSRATSCVDFSDLRVVRICKACVGLYESALNPTTYTLKAAFAKGASFAAAFFAVALGVWVLVQGLGLGDSASAVGLGLGFSFWFRLWGGLGLAFGVLGYTEYAIIERSK